MKKGLSGILICLAVSIVLVDRVLAQVDIVITPPESGFTLAVPPPCASGKGEDLAEKLASVIADDLALAGLFKTLGPKKESSPLGECEGKDGGPFTEKILTRDIHAFVTGKLRLFGKREKLLVIDLYLFDVKKRKAVLGRRYEGEAGEEEQIAHMFASEIIGAITGERGIFGGRIVFVSDVGSHRELFVTRLGSTGRKQLTEDKAVARSPAWSSEGKKIVYTSVRDDSAELHVVPSDGGRSRRITYLPGKEIGAQFLPGGKTLVTAAEISGFSTLVVFNLKGRLLRQLTESAAHDIDPALSPDGTQIIFASDRKGKYQLYMMNTEGGRARAITQETLRDCHSPVWSPKGDKIAFTCEEKGFNQLFLIVPGEKDIQQLTFQGDNRDPSWSPDGRFIVYSTKRKKGGPRNLAIYSLLGLKTSLVIPTPNNDSEPAWAPFVAE